MLVRLFGGMLTRDDETLDWINGVSLFSGGI
jgi:hypothetical protein